MALSRIERKNKIKKRIRTKVLGTSQKPRMSIFRSNRQISVQLIDDINAATIASATSLQKEIYTKKATKTEKAKMVGELIAQNAIKKGINNIVFDRSGYLYHGKIKALANGAREKGLKF